MAGIAGKLIPLCVVVILILMGYLSFTPASEEEAAVGEDVPGTVEPATTDQGLYLAKEDKVEFDISVGPAFLDKEDKKDVTDTDSDGDGLSDETELDLDLDEVADELRGMGLRTIVSR